MIADAGFLRPNEGDHLALIADELIRQDSVSIVIVFCILSEERKVRICARCENPLVDLNQLLKAKFSHASAGAKLTPDGRGEDGALVSIDFGLWYQEGAKESMGAFIRSCMEQLFLS